MFSFQYIKHTNKFSLKRKQSFCRTAKNLKLIIHRMVWANGHIHRPKTIIALGQLKFFLLITRLNQLIFDCCLYGLGVQNIQLFANLKTLKAQYEINYLSKSTKNIYVLSSRIWEWEVKCNASQWFEPRNSNLFLSFTQTTFIHWNTYARSTQT